LAAANFAVATAGMVVAGILQLVARDLGWTPREAGRLITLYAAGFAVCAPLLGAAMGQWCRKQVVLLGLSCVASGSVFGALAEGAPWLQMSRLVVAAGAAMAVPSVSAIAAYLFPNDKPRALAAVLAGMTLASLAGVPAATFVAGVWGWHVPLLAAGVIAAGAAALIKLRLPGGIVVPPVPLSAWRELLGRASTYPLLGLSLLAVAATFSVYAYIAPFLQAMLGYGARELSWTLLWFGLSNLGGSALLARIGDRVPRPRLLAGSLLGLVLALGAASLVQDRPWLFAGVAAAWSVATAFAGTLQQTRIAEASPTASSAMLALNTSAVFAGQALGTMAGGVVVTRFGVHALPWMGSAIAGLALLLFLAARR